jgi:hypothetical protein
MTHRAERDAVPDVLAELPQCQALVDCSDGCCGRFSEVAFRACLESGELRQRILVGAAGQYADGRHFVGFAEVGKQHCRGARLLETGLDVAHRFAADRGVECRNGGRIGIPEHRVRRREPHGRVVRTQCQPTERIANDTTQRVVDLDLGKVGLGGRAHGFAAQGIAQLDVGAGFVADEDRIVGLADIKCALRQRGEKPFNGRRPGGAEFTHHNLGGLEIIGRREPGDKMAQSGFVCGSADERCRQHEARCDYVTKKTHVEAPVQEDR